ncbi:ABC transporter permease [Nocardioides sp. zg-536]|uniref:ABC transporter permease n=1 Tax=Nocardioides faecalis TaxID=2803858 RepID=A0A938Y7N6_9ACTN|nr:ABC transporter permease [Nocardioides faecalis]MBM9460790.1 ABC transporter permease [Nocardioides faecalis]QVI57982.1 ABC transporter permease [Nocardioides faecalis]
MSTGHLPPPPPPSQPATHQPAPAASGVDLRSVLDTPRVPFWRLLLVELRKSYDTRAGFWLLAAIGILVALVEGFVFVLTLVYEESILFEDFAFIAGGITSLLLPVLAIMLVTGEWSQRSAMVTFALEPRRSRVIGAKFVAAMVYVVATLVAMLAIALVLTTVCELVQPDQTYWQFDLGEFLAFGLGQAITMTIGFAFACLLLNTPAAIVLFFLYWYLLPVVLGAIGMIREGVGDALEWINLQIAIGPLTEGTLDSGEEWGKLIVSAVVWIGLPLGLGLLRILRAEVK